MVRRRVCLALLVVMMGAIPCFAFPYVPGGFEDPALVAALIDGGACGGDRPLPPQVMRPEWVISMEGVGIWSLMGIEKAVNLSQVSLTDGTFSNLAYVGDLTKLTYVDFRQNAVRDLTPLGGLAKLDVLTLDGNRVTDITPLAELDRLWWLHLADNSLQDISPLAALTGLGRLDLRGNPLNAEAYSTILPLIEANNPGIDLQYDSLIPRADADMDGDVDLDDLAVMQQAFGSEGGWQDGDFDGDGHITLDDFVILKQNHVVSPVPEPATLSLLALGATALARHRGRRARRWLP